MEALHEKQRKQLSAAQERKMQYEKMINEIQNRHLKDEVRASLAKNLQVRMNHQIALNKRLGDQLREIQQTEAQQAKERFDLDIKCFDEMEALKAEHISRKSELETSQNQELVAEKERIAAKNERDKVSQLEIQHAADIKKLSQQHRQHIRNLKAQQEISLQQRYRNVDSALVASTVKSSSASPSRSRQPGAHSATMSRAESAESIDRGESDMGSVAGGRSSINCSTTNRSANALNLSNVKMKFDATQEDEEIEDAVGSADNISDKGKIALRALQKKHHEALVALTATLKQDMDDCKLSIEARLRELDDSSDLQLQSLKADHAEEIQNIISVQEKEIAMEASVHDAELKMLVERRILNSVLDTVVDGIINIIPLEQLRDSILLPKKCLDTHLAKLLERILEILCPQAILSSMILT